ncbi:hypothetical protein [Actinoplanes sp. NPDC020271]|uniref:hypothetical protein n=1 Tax=Actinoplanes sp. NPDC020271 TaxID=3363896 RepID=UPI00379F4925
MLATPIVFALAGNPGLQPGHIDALLAMNDPDLSQEVARREDLSAAQIARLASSGQQNTLVALVESGSLAVERIPRDDPRALLAAIGRADAPNDLLPRLANWPDPAVRRALSEHASARADIAYLVANDEDCSVAAGAARLWELPEKLALLLWGRAEACVRTALASNIHAPGAILADLIRNGGEPGIIPCPHQPGDAAVTREVRLLAAGNPATPVSAVEPLAARPDSTWAAALARRSDLSDETYRHLLELRDHDVTAGVAANWAAPPDLLRALYDLEASRWRHCVLANPRTPLDLLVRYSREGGSPPTEFHPDLDGLLTLARDADPRVRLVAAASFRLPADVRATLIDDEDFDVACRATRHYTVSAEQVRTFVARYGSRVFSQVAGHPSCPPDVLLAIATEPTSSAEEIIDVAVHESAPPTALEACLRHPHAVAGIAGNPSTPPDMLIKLAAHSDPRVLWELAGNPSLPAIASDLIIKNFAAS